jgi:hypothetical protein
MARGLDHVVHAVLDLDAAAEFYHRLGFVVGPRNFHAWGTHNRIVQFSGVFLELLTLAEPEKLEGKGLSVLFGRFHQKFLERYEGLSALMLESQDADADAIEFHKAGIAASQAVRFERQGSRPDGSAVTVGFGLAFATDRLAPHCAFATCRQKHPELFWDARLQAHPNTATTMRGVVLVAENPTDHHIFLSAFTGERDLQATSSGISVVTPRGEIQVMDPRAFSDHYRVPSPDIARGARLAAVRFGVENLTTMRDILGNGGIGHQVVMNRVIIPAENAFGATLVFEQRAN